MDEEGEGESVTEKYFTQKYILMDHEVLLTYTHTHKQIKNCHICICKYIYIKFTYLLFKIIITTTVTLIFSFVTDTISLISNVYMYVYAFDPVSLTLKSIRLQFVTVLPISNFELGVCVCMVKGAWQWLVGWEGEGTDLCVIAN